MLKIVHKGIFLLAKSLTDNSATIHLAKLNDSFLNKEYLCFVCFYEGVRPRVYVEEVVGGHLERISSDAEVADIENLLKEKGILDYSYIAGAHKLWNDLKTGKITESEATARIK